jgi:arylsulfatase A-like enzyme
MLEPYLDAHAPLDALTLATALGQNGYRTGHVGKWHVGLTSAHYGFDFSHEDRGVHRGMADRTRDFATADDKTYPLSKEKYPPVSAAKPAGISYPYDGVTETALKFMKESKSEPFFLYLCHWMVHWPVLTRNGELLEYYCDKFNQPFPPKPGDMRLEGQQNPYFAAMVTTVDWSLGRVVDFLKRTDDPRNPGKKLIETTYIFFSSDNGGAERHAREIISDNAPLKNGKKYTEEGGIRVPLLIAGPGVPAAGQYDGLVNQLDFFPTILNLTGSTIAPGVRTQLSGLDITQVIKGNSRKITDARGNERKNLFWHYPHGSTTMKGAIREGDYKLYKHYASDEYSLFRLYENGRRLDLEENNNLANDPEHAAVLDRLRSNLENHLAANNATMPYLNPAYTKHNLKPARIASFEFSKSTRQARLETKSQAPRIKEAYIVYRRLDGPWTTENKKFRGKGTLVGSPPVGFGVKIPAHIGNDGRAVSATIPDNVPACFFVLIDENNFQLSSEIKAAK